MNTADLIYCFNDIDDELLNRSERRGAFGRRLARTAAAAAAILLVIGAAYGIARAVGAEGAQKPVSAWANLPEGYEFMADTYVPKDAALPETQVGGSPSSPSYARSYTFAEAYEHADAACIVTIRDRLGETESGTYFEAKLEKLYKGELPETFTIYQCANSEFHMYGSPLFTYGDKLLVFLIPWGLDGYEDSYDLVGCDIAMFYVAASRDGGIYLIDHKGVFSLVNTERARGPRPADHVSDAKLCEELFDYIGSFDKAMADMLAEYRNVTVTEPEYVQLPLHIYALEDIVAIFESVGD